MMGLYEASFLALVAGCGILTWQQYRRQDIDPAKTPLLNSEIPTPESRLLARKFTRLFLVVYMLVMGADWLQGPYVYALYKNELGFPERTVAALFTTGFLSGAISGYFVGSFADRYGRRTACLTFCITYSLSCLTILRPSLPTLFAARTLGGLSTSLLYSAFESWMVTEFHARRLETAGSSLSRIFGIMTTANSIVAIAAGVFSEWLVEYSGTKRAPFLASAAVLCIAFSVIRCTWTENYGSNSTSLPPASPTAAKEPRLISALLSPRILSLGLASATFEGSMYLFVFFWTPALQSVARRTLPFGLIFAAFMACLMLGSLVFALLVSAGLVTPSRLLTATFVVASAALLFPVLWKCEPATFAAFCVFEACVGVYYPCMGYLKGAFVDDGIRARVYGVLRVPLNVFVVGALALTREGAGFRDGVFVVCSALLVVTSGVLHFAVGRERSEERIERDAESEERSEED